MAPQSIFRYRFAAMLALTLLASCQPAPPVPKVAMQRPPSAPLPLPEPAPAPRIAATIDEYKVLVAQRIAGANISSTFHGVLPAMLPAIVVLDISVDRDGALTNVRVHRSRDEQASKVALAAVRLAAPFPQPLRLIRPGHHLEFSETFLFDDDYRFQLRSLVEPQ